MTLMTAAPTPVSGTAAKKACSSVSVMGLLDRRTAMAGLWNGSLSRTWESHAKA